MDHDAKNDPALTSPGLPTALQAEFQEQLRSVKSPAERQSIIELVRNIATLPLDQAAAALETSAAIAGVSWRASIEFLRAIPEVTRILGAAELRSWGELGRRVTLGDIESGVSFFIAGVAELKLVPPEARPLLFQVCLRQIMLSSTVAVETLRSAPLVAGQIADTQMLVAVFDIASEISRRSAKHSAEFLAATPKVVSSLRAFKDEPAVIAQALELAAAFAHRAGGIASDAWQALPAAMAGLERPQARLLLAQTLQFLERGGGAALQVLVSGGEMLRLLPAAFPDWIELLWLVSEHGNAGLVAFVRGSPRFIRAIINVDRRGEAVELAKRVIKLTQEIARV